MNKVGCDREEAIYYVETAKGDYEMALEKYTEDEKWATQNQHSMKFMGYGSINHT